jgi:hypothetical protein
MGWVKANDYIFKADEVIAVGPLEPLPIEAPSGGVEPDIQTRSRSVGTGHPDAVQVSQVLLRPKPRSLPVISIGLRGRSHRCRP